MSSKRTAPKVAIVLDTNCLYTEAADKLVCQDISDFILQEVPTLGVEITWHLPSVVKAERRHQMLERARKLLLACTRFRRHRVRCFDGAGGRSWKDGSLRGSSSLRLCA